MKAPNTISTTNAETRVRGLLCTLLKTLGKEHRATRTVINHLVTKHHSL